MTKRTSDGRGLARGNRDAYFRTTKAPGPIELAPGTTVGYTRYFLMQLGISATDPMWGQRGKIQEKHPTIATWVYVLWDGEEKPTLISSSALAVPGPNLRWCE